MSIILGKQAELDETEIADSAVPTTTPARWLGRYYDLLALSGLALIFPWLAASAAPGLLKVPVGLVMVLFGPGYALTETAFDRPASLDRVARIGISVGLSIALVPVMALALSASPWGMRPGPINIALAGWTVGLCLLAALRRWQIPELPTAASRVRWRPGWAIGVTLVLALGLVLVGLVVAGLTVPTNNPALTEFYMVGSDGMAESYPRQATVGENLSLVAGINNQEGAEGLYRVEIRQGNQLLMSSPSIRLKSGEKWEQPLQFKLTRAGDDQPVELLLFHNDQPTVYRQLRLWINVK